MPKGNTRPKTKTKRTRRPRRSTEEIIDRLMEAACEEFERTGYAGTTTAAIAKKAGVVEALIYSNFGSKAKLFQDSIFKPLNRHLLEFCATHLVDPGDPNTFRQNTRQYILELQHFIERHSGMMISLAWTWIVASEFLESTPYNHVPREHHVSHIVPMGSRDGVYLSARKQ